MKPQILIAGAGPTGLALALNLAKQQIPFKIIDKEGGPGEASRAMAVMPRTLEFYDQFGFADEFVNGGIKIEGVYLHVEGKEKAHLDLGKVGKGISRFTSPYSFPQDEHEKVLLKQLDRYKVKVEWNTELLSFEETDEGVLAVLICNGEEFQQEFLYIAGCDGASSVVRHQMQADFPGGTYEQEFYVMDMKAEGAPIGSHQLAMCMHGEEFVVLLPVRSTDTTRAIGVFPDSMTASAQEVTSEKMVDFMQSAFRINVKEVNWFSTYKVHHRVAEVFRKGRAFLVGDAAHIHSPAGGQGMNTGIGDAMNLGWKLAAVVQGKAKHEVLKTYETERKAFAQRLVDTTDRVFTRVVSKKRSNRLFRKRIAPLLIPLVNRSDRARRRLFTILSQTQIEYTKSRLSRGKVNELQSGIRLPYNGENYEVLRTWDWQVHVYGAANSELRNFCQERGLALHTFKYDSAAEKHGFSGGALYLVRPDGHIGFAHPDRDVARLQKYVDDWGIIPFNA
ncbi:FAD-dependent monooxygenase [Halobacillus naozhouensis]|uniref:FAD-dependent monooxygenase n=1 Tax=Halobacillus naozhouensis TaxID=554880 RepID=A0ABY8J0F6_9BACI|nr:FAD-dependent monooxygenase [Halobacillus naozhouensis]WFT75975.1 FAD-dependent monooxygenase [Halobacillus naozhouensis]